jgi:hypothetical protein
MKTYKEFISELTQSELDVEAKKVNQNTTFKVGNKGRTKDKISDQEMKRLKERCKNGVFRKVLGKIQK